MHVKTILSIILAAGFLSGCQTGPYQQSDGVGDGSSQGGAGSAGTNVEFVVIGDMPYSDEENEALTAPDGKFVKAIAALDPSVVVHYGDLKAGGENCDYTLMSARRDQVAGLHPGRVVFTPGDNDWTDCDRDFLSERFGESDRLALLRGLFYTGEGLQMSRDVPELVRQDGLTENAMWRIGDLAMGTLHIVGTDNGRREILLGDVDVALDAVDYRDAKNMAWLEQMFSSAKSAKGLAIIFQADMYRPVDPEKAPKPVCSDEVRTGCDAYTTIRNAMENMAAKYGKPVIAIHGDTNAGCFNQPSEVASNFWHLNGPGDYKFIDAAVVSFQPDADVPFSVSGLLEGGTMPEVCDYSR